jgi:hypothetical protein
MGSTQVGLLRRPGDSQKAADGVGCAYFDLRMAWDRSLLLRGRINPEGVVSTLPVDCTAVGAKVALK